MPNPNQNTPLYLITARDKVLRYLADELNRRVLRQRLAIEGIYPAYAQTIAAACPELARNFYEDVIDMVRRALLAEKPQMVKRPGRAA